MTSFRTVPVTGLRSVQSLVFDREPLNDQNFDRFWGGLGVGVDNVWDDVNSYRRPGVVNFVIF